MSWAEIKKAINTNVNKALDVLIAEKHATTDNLISWEVGTAKQYVAQAHQDTDALIHDVHNVMSNKMDAHLDHIANNATYGLNALLTAINSIKNGGSVKVIKSVQRGHASATYLDTDIGTTVSLSTIDPNKSIVFIDGITNSDRSWLFTVTANSLYVPYESKSSDFNGKYYTPAFSWQVIEFY